MSSRICKNLTFRVLAEQDARQRDDQHEAGGHGT
jgi:hypothetical protein